MRKVFTFFVLSLITYGVASAQPGFKIPEIKQDFETPKISVGELKWEKAIAPPVIPTYEMENRQDAERIWQSSRNPFPPGGLKIYYDYQAFFKNDGVQKVVGMSWEYIFYDLESDKELDRHKIFSFQTIGKGKSAAVKGASFAPPSKVVTYKSLELNSRSPYTERVEVRCVLYSNNTFWKRENVAPQECRMLNFNRWRHRQRRRLFD